MSFAKLLAIVRRYDHNATIIFDREEPIGLPTDLVMPRRRWFRSKRNTFVGQALPPAEGKRPSKTTRRQAGALALQIAGDATKHQ